MSFVIINIGSNLGDRKLNLSRAVSAINRRFGEFEMSHAVESAPWGFDSTHSFLNVGLTFHTDLEPEELLDELQKIEQSISTAPHRRPDGSYTDRIIDIDIVAIDRLTINSPRLQIPHPHLAERRFFLEPLDELAGGWIHPVSGLTAAGMLMQLNARNEDQNSAKC